ncbi:MAG: hypothetical protein NEHIOOID_01191 [Holosporales bacterium]
MKYLMCFLMCLSTMMFASKSEDVDLQKAIVCLKEKNNDVFKKILKEIQKKPVSYLISVKHNNVQDQDQILLHKHGGHLALKADVRNVEDLKTLDNVVISWNAPEEDFTLKPMSQKEASAFLARSKKSTATHEKVQKEVGSVFDSKPGIVNSGTVRDYVSQARMTDLSTIENRHQQ